MSKTIKAVFNDDDDLLGAVNSVRKAKYHIEEVFSPFPVHGLDKAMGLEPTKLAIASFMYGCVGFGTAIFLTWYTMNLDWPQDIGGKPSFSWSINMPAFVPVIFELTVFFAAHLMVITFYLRSRLWPGKEAENPDPRTTDDLFIMEVLVDKEDDKKIVELLKKSGAISIDN